MINKILNALKKCSASAYLIEMTENETTELFFVKKNLDLRRMTNTVSYYVSVYHDYEKNGTKMRGVSAVGIYDGMSQDEIDRTVAGAYYAASFVANPYYEIPSGKKENQKNMESSLNPYSTGEIALKMAEALYTEDIRTDVFVNSAELFAQKSFTRLLNSNGIDVSFAKSDVKGEFVIQCPSPQDVETYRSFSYDELETEALKAKTRQALDMTLARAQAVSAPLTGEYDVILSGPDVGSLFTYYTDRANSAYVYPKYSSYAAGTEVQGEKVQGELLNITMVARTPYSNEGIPMKDRQLVKDGTLQFIHGNARYACYLGIEPTGSYTNIRVPAGKKTMEELRTGRYLEVVNCSDFSMDSLSGHFGSEIRLAFYHDGEKTIPVTGGSFAGSIYDIQSNFAFSKELQTDGEYEGPYAVKMKNIKIAGK